MNSADTNDPTNDTRDPNDSAADAAQPQIGRNEPCPCGSGKKYKRCHGVGAPPILGEAKNPMGFDPSQMPEGFDPSAMDPQWLMQFTQMLQRLPKGQLNRMQQLMGKAMQGKDVSAEAQAFESSLPLELQNLVRSANAGEAGAAGTDASTEMAPEQKAEAQSKFSKFFNKLMRK